MMLGIFLNAGVLGALWVSMSLSALRSSGPLSPTGVASMATKGIEHYLRPD